LECPKLEHSRSFARGCDAHAVSQFVFDCCTEFREGRAYVEDDNWTSSSLLTHSVTDD